MLNAQAARDLVAKHKAGDIKYFNDLFHRTLSEINESINNAAKEGKTYVTYDLPYGIKQRSNEERDKVLLRIRNLGYMARLELDNICMVTISW